MLESFFGRREVLRRLYSRICADRPQSVAIIGGKGIGKTAFLQYAAADPVQVSNHKTTKLFFDCIAAQTPDGFLARMGTELGFGDRSGQYEPYRNSLERFLADGTRVIFFLDNFHAVTGSSVFPLEFFSFLRSLANNLDIAYVTSSLLDMQELCAMKIVEESPFFNIFTNITLSPLKQEEAALLMARLTGLAAEDLQSISRWSGGIPLLVDGIAKQIADSGLVDPKQYGTEYEKITIEYYSAVVERLPENALDVLLRIGRRKSIHQKQKHLIRQLIKQGFVAETNKKILPFSPSFEGFLRYNLNKKMLGGA